MSTPDFSLNKNPLSPWHTTLTGLGFSPRGGGYRRNSLKLKSADGWFALESPHTPEANGGAFGQLGQFGFWKCIQTPEGLLQVFEFPHAAVAPAEESEWADTGLDLSLAPFLRFALASKTNQRPAGWQPPARVLVESWLASGALTVQAGPVVRQGELILNADRWALRCPILAHLPTGLPAARRAWLELILADAQNQWRMVRVGIAGPAAHPAVLCEVDFTGAPAAEYLFLAGLYALRQVVAWLAESVEVVADVNVASQTLTLHPHKNPNPERKAA